MYSINNITDSYEILVKKIREINTALDELCEETKENDKIKIEIADDRDVKVSVIYGENKFELIKDFDKIIDSVAYFYERHPNELKELTPKDKIIKIIEEDILNRAALSARDII